MNNPTPTESTSEVRLLEALLAAEPLYRIDPDDMDEDIAKAIASCQPITHS